MRLERYKELYDLESTHWWYVGKRKIVLSLLKKYLKPSPDLKALDAGCGTGIFLNDLEKEYGTATGMDSSEEALKFCKLRGHTKTIRANATEIPMRDGSFDLVTALDLLEHIEQDVQALKEFHRILAPQGLLLIAVPAHPFLWSEHDLALLHKRRYSKNDLKKKITEAGFKIIKLSYTNSFIFPIAFLVRIFKKIFQEEKTEHAIDIVALPNFINKILKEIYNVEALLLRGGNLPFGVSLVCIAKKCEL